jgi:hypothetical protein
MGYRSNIEPPPEGATMKTALLDDDTTAHFVIIPDANDPTHFTTVFADGSYVRDWASSEGFAA